VDEAVRALSAGLPEGVAVVAVGGYGRGSLAPGSDIDLMVLHDHRRAAAVRQAAEQLFYPFWDAGLPLGHAVRTVRDCVAGARERLDTACSLLDARVLWGERRLADELARRLATTLLRDPAGLLRRLADDAEARHAAHPACTTDLEPDLKDGAGGLRDLHAVDWGGRPFAGDREGLVAAGLLRRREAAALGDAEEFLVRLRSALHLETRRRSDRLYRELQPALAEAFGFEATTGLEAPDALMRHLFEHARHVALVREVFLERALDARKSGAGTDAAPAEASVEGAMRAFAGAAERGEGLDPAVLDSIESADLGAAPPRWSFGTRDAFLSILAAGQRGARALEAMDRIGLLSRFLPEWEPVRCRPQRDPYHRFTVDVHLLRTAAQAADLLRGEGADPLLARAAGLVRDRAALLLGAFLHDIGKTGRGGHVGEGKRIAGSALERMGVADSTRDLVLFLVAEHLLLSETAIRRDLTDENLVLDVAARVRDPERLAMLFLLTAADAAATGPQAWTPWRQALIRELTAKAEHVLERGEMGAGRAEVLEERLAAVRRLLEKEDPHAVEAYVARLPRPYLLAVMPETVAGHFDMVVPPLGAAEVRTAAVEGDRPGTHDVTVVARDRPGLLASIAGAVALVGLNILSARAFTTEDGVAIDLFTVEPTFPGQEVEEHRWRQMRAALRKALEGRISLDHSVREKRRHYRRPAGGVPVEVHVDNEASDFATVVDVSAPDRIGLLFDLARTFHELALDVHLAKVATYGSRVVDAFYVRELSGGKVEAPRRRREIEAAVVARLAESD
jgi:[protein-PII] uridylyltransferase